MLTKSRVIFPIMGLFVVATLIAAFPDTGYWGVKTVEFTDVLFYWEYNFNYTYDEAKAICLKRNMPSRIFLDQISYEIPYFGEFWAPHVVEPPEVLRISTHGSDILRKYSASNARSVVCTATLTAALLMFHNGTTTYLKDQPIPHFCYPQQAHRNDFDLKVCVLMIQKYEL